MSIQTNKLNATAAPYESTVKQSAQTQAKSVKEQDAEALKKELEIQKQKYDNLKLSDQYKASTTRKAASKSEETDALWAEYESKTQAFQSLLTSMFGKQANNFNVSKKDLSSANFGSSDIESAKSSIADGGYFSVDAVATRIMDMAKSLANGDDSKLSVLKGAVEKGFAAAGKVYGGKDKLPDISHKTYEEVMKRFDEWENPPKAEANTDLADK